MILDISTPVTDGQDNTVPNGKSGTSMTMANLIIMACMAGDIPEDEAAIRRGYIGLLVGDAIELSDAQATELAEICETELPTDLAAIAARAFS